MHATDAQTTITPVAQSSPPIGRIAIALVIPLVIGLIYYFDLGHHLFNVVKDNRDRLLAFTDANFTSSIIIFISAYIVVTGLSLPLATVLTVAGGFLFGSILGTLLVNIGATTGATLAFLSARYLLRDWVENKFGRFLGPIQEGISKNAFSFLLSARLLFVIPFFVLNLVSGLTRVNVGTYVLATALGIIPGSFVYANAGRQLGSGGPPKPCEGGA
ncbi:MAG: TVP38/TMEM64 family protein [Nitrospirae bacterium]|nr:TVP38/TMEM64 family protein [Nitrospirota bacterium]